MSGIGRRLGTPLVTLTLIAALVSLPPDPFEQAQIDGAGKRQIFSCSGTSWLASPLAR